MGSVKRTCRLILVVLAIPLIIVLLLLLGATIRALTIEDIDYQYEGIENHLLKEIPDSYLEGLPEVFAGALRIPTISTAPGDYDTEQLLVLHQYLRDSFPDVFNSSFINLEIINSYSFLFTVKGSDESVQPYMLAAHFDVVPVDETKWSRPPFGGEILPDPETGEMFIWGRGAIDDKINIMSIMMALQYLMTSGFQPRRTFYVAFGHDEEVSGFDGAGHIGQVLQQRGVTLDFLMDEGLPVLDDAFPGIHVPVAAIGVTEKGWMRVTLEVEGEGGHSSMPPKDQVAARLGRALSNLEQYPQPSMFGTGPEAEMFDYLAPKTSWPLKLVFANIWLFKPVLELVMSSSRETNAVIRTTTAATIVRVGVKENVVPTSGYAVINHRVHPAQSLDDVIQHDINVINDPKVKVVSGDRREAHPVSPYGPEVPGWRLIASTVKHYFPTSIPAPGMLIGNTDTQFYLNLTSCVYRFSPHRMSPKMLTMFHGHNERVSVSSLKGAVRWFHRLILSADLDVPALQKAKPGHRSGEF